MRWSIFIVLFTVFLIVPTIQAADSFEATACRSGTITMVHASKELMVLSVELKGLLQSDTEMLNNVSEICVGTMKRMGEKTTQMGYCKYLYPNGDINVVEFDGVRNSGNVKFLLGTGKWANIKGSGTWQNIQRVKPIVKGTFQNCIKLKGSYKLPK